MAFRLTIVVAVLATCALLSEASAKDYAATAAPPPRAQEVRTLVVQFGGPEHLGRSVATILNLQLWRTLRKTSASQPNSDFGQGAVVWLGKTLASDTHEVAGNAAQPLAISAQLVLWGHVHEIGEEALVTAYLTIPKYFDFRMEKHEVWDLPLDVGGERLTLSVDVPQRYYAFKPLALPADFVRKFNTPDAIPILSRKEGGRQIGVLGPAFTRLGNDGDFAKVQADGKTGWVYLPEIGRHKPEIVDFIGGIIRIFRADWTGAIEQFRMVLENPATPTALRIDSYLYVIRAKSELRQDADEEIGAAAKLTLASRRFVQYAAMHYLDRCYGGPAGAARAARCDADTRQHLRDLLSEAQELFESDDLWLTQALQVIHE
jgi:hypothetical protein